MRAFVAIEIPNDEVIGRLLAVQTELSSTGADLKLVERENLHFTVRFLGEISEPQAETAKARLGALHLPGGEVSVAGLGAFPSLGRPSVVWAGVSEKDESYLASVAGPIISSLQDMGEPDKRPFRAHLTIARVKSPRRNVELSAFIRGSASRQFGSSKIGEFKLKSSLLTPRGPIYADIGVYSLNE